MTERQPLLRNARCPNGCDDYQSRWTSNPFANCGRCGTRMVFTMPRADGEQAPQERKP